VQPFLLPPLFVAKVAPLHTTFFFGGYPSHCAATAAQWEGSGLPACLPAGLCHSLFLLCKKELKHSAQSLTRADEVICGLAD